MAQNLHKKIFS